MPSQEEREAMIIQQEREETPQERMLKQRVKELAGKLQDAKDAEIARLKAELAGVREAMKRYEWLKSNHLQLGPDCWIRTGEDLDEAIDAEIEQAIGREG